MEQPDRLFFGEATTNKVSDKTQFKPVGSKVPSLQSYQQPNKDYRRPQDEAPCAYEATAGYGRLTV